jgi:undecaprenyl-diphosphatase
MKPPRTFWVWLIAIVLGVLLVIFAFSLDAPVHVWQKNHVWKNITLLRQNVTHGTDWYVHFGIGLSFAALAWWRGSQKWTRVFLAMVAAGALAGASAYTLKVATGRVRPSVKIEKVWGKQNLQQNFQAFPSGHTAVSTGFFAILFFVNWRVGLLCLPIPLFVAFSRIFLGAHYFSDVVAGIVLGILGAMLIAQTIGPFDHRSAAANSRRGSLGLQRRDESSEE